jgi:hypothetical protein
MKTGMFWKWSQGLALAVLPLVGGYDQESANSAPAMSLDTNQPPAAEIAAITNAASPEAAEQQLEAAPGQVVSTVTPPPQSVNISGPAAEIAKLAQAGLEENVMLSYVMNCPHTFNLSSDAIIYLNDIGVSSTVVTAMIQHDQSIRESSADSSASPNQPVQSPESPGPSPAPNAPTETAVPQPSPPEVIDNGQPPTQVNGSYSYFYGSLAPYGSWINVDGYGLCWQPTVVVANPAWRPYCEGGHWAYTDYGWCWVSDYSWGWAPFHYGRWFHHHRWGWCWAPDTFWGPAWVSWRYGHDHCGWAPLPPTACYTPRIGFTYLGRHVGFDFSFGLSADLFTFVGFDHFTDRHWRGYRVPPQGVRGFFNRTVVAHGIVERNGRIVNQGIPVGRIVAATHREVPRMHLQDAADPASIHANRFDRAGGGLAVFRPNLPPPAPRPALVGQGIRPRIGTRAISGAARTPTIVDNGATRQPPGNLASPPRRVDTTPAFNNTGSVPNRNGVRPGYTAPAPGKAAPVIQRSQDRLNSSINGRQPIPPRPSQPALNQSLVRAASPPPVQPQTQPPSRQVLRKEAPKHLQQDQMAFTTSAAPAPRQPVTRTFQWAPAAEPREQQRWMPPAQQAPPGRSQPALSVPSRVQSPPSAQPNHDAPPAARGSRQDNSRNNR